MRCIDKDIKNVSLIFPIFFISAMHHHDKHACGL